MKRTLLVVFLFALLIVVINSYASSLNPCEYMNLNTQAMNKLDTGDDPNFERIKQQNNQEMIRRCQELEIKALEEMRNDLNRDNY